MTWPFENDTSQIMKKLAVADLKNHRMKTMLSGIIIFLATCLMASVFIFFFNDAFDRANASTYHAMYQAINTDIQSRLESNEQLKSIGIYKYFGDSFLESGGRTTCVYMDNTVLDVTGCTILSGTMPENENEVMISTQYLKEIGQSKQLGDTVHISYIDSLTNQSVEHDFIICGFIKNREQEFLLIKEKGCRQNYRLTPSRPAEQF